MWLDPGFAVQVLRWTSRFISVDLTLVHDLVERHESVNAGTRVLATVTSADVDIDRDVHKLLHQDNAIEQENAQLKVRIAQVVKDAETGEEKLLQELVQVKLDLVKAEAHGGQLAAAGEALGEELQAEQERSEGLVTDSRALRESAQEMNSELERIETERDRLQSDNGHKKRRLFETQAALDHTTCMGRVLYHHYLHSRGDLEQLATAEQLDGLDPLSGVGSKPARYVALKNVHAGSCGREDRLIRDLNRDTFDSLGQNLTRWSMSHKPSRQQKFAAVTSILDYEFDSDSYRTPFSSVTWRCLLYGVFKTKFELQYSTWATLLDMLHLSARSNTWFSGRSFALDFQLMQQRDLERALGLTYHPALALPASQRDIRHWLTNMTPEQALQIREE